MTKDVQGPETQTESDYTKVEQEHYHRITTMVLEVDKLKASSDRAKEKAKTAKQRWEAAAEELHDLIRRGPDPQPKLPGMEDVDEKSDAEGWRSVSLADVGLVGRLAKPFEETKLATLGDLVDWQAEDLRTLQDLPGVGEKTAEKIEELLTQFWANHPEWTQPESEEEYEEEDEDEEDTDE